MNALRALVPRRFRFESSVAFRHLWYGGSRTLLPVSAVATGVIIVIFITSLIFGLQDRTIELLTEAIPHVTIQAEEPPPMPLAEVTSTSPELSSTRIEQQAYQRKFIDNWLQVMNVVRGLKNVRTVAPVVRGQGFVSRGANPIGVTVIGADEELQDEVVRVTKHLIAGKYLGLSSEEVVIDAELAKDLNVGTGERIRLTSSTGTSDSFTVAGIYSRGQERGSAYVTLRTGQNLFGYGTSVNGIFVKVNNIHDSDRVADRIRALLPYYGRSWTAEYPSFLSSVRVQTVTGCLLSIFTLVASAFAIASVLVVSVFQKSKQIGILKTMGAQSRQIMTIFALEGLGIALIGSTAGAILGTLIVYGLSLFERPVLRFGQIPDQLFPVRVLPFYIALAMLAAVLSTVIAAVMPARRAAKLNPVEVLR